MLAHSLQRTNAGLNDKIPLGLAFDAAAALAQQFRVLFQPRFGHAIFRAELRDFLPEFGGMIHVPTMGQFVPDDVIAHKIRGLNQPPVQ
jgi:hypothetical protein